MSFEVKMPWSIWYRLSYMQSQLVLNYTNNSLLWPNPNGYKLTSHQSKYWTSSFQLTFSLCIIFNLSRDFQKYCILNSQRPVVTKVHFPAVNMVQRITRSGVLTQELNSHTTWCLTTLQFMLCCNCCYSYCES